jgi:hypothetical protein
MRNLRAGDNFTFSALTLLLMQPRSTALDPAAHSISDCVSAKFHKTVSAAALFEYEKRIMYRPQMSAVLPGDN